MVFDAIKSVEELQKAGIPEPHAKAQVRLLQGVIESNLATKRDIEELRKATARDLNERLQKTEHSFGERLQATENSLGERLQTTENSLGERLQTTEKSLSERLQATQLDMKDLEFRLTIKLGAMIAATFWLLVALTRLKIL